LYAMFQEYGGVKKAWLHSYRTVGRTNQQPPHNHRGFGFVIFYDANSVENMLGKSYSCFLPLPDGRKLEVKRAVPSSDLPGKPGGSGSSSQARGNGSGGGRGGGNVAAPGGALSGPLGNSLSGCGGHSEQPSVVGMAPPLPMPAGAPMPMAASMQAGLMAGNASMMPPQWGPDLRAPANVQPWPTYVGAPSLPSQAMTIPQPMGHAHSLSQPPQSMMIAPMQYAAGYSGFTQNLAVQHQQQQQHQPNAMPPLQQQGLPGYPLMQGLQVVNPHGGAVQHSSVFQQPRTM